MKSGKPLLLGLWISTLWGLAGCVSVPLPNQNPTSVASLPINLSVEPEESPKPLVTEALITESLLSKEMPLETHGDLPGTTPAFAGLVSLQATDVVSEALKRNQSLVGSEPRPRSPHRSCHCLEPHRQRAWETVRRI